MALSKVLIVSNGSKNDQHFIRQLTKINPKYEITLTSYTDINVLVDRSKTLIQLKDGNTDVASFDLVFFKTTNKQPDLAATIGAYLNKRNVRFIDQATMYAQVSSKIYQYIVLSDNKILVPASVFMLRNRLKDSYPLLVHKLGLPFILKDIHGRMGKVNYLIKNRRTFDEVVKAAKDLNKQLVAQEYIPNVGDYRLLIFGDKVYLILYRRRVNNSTHLNNVSAGGSFKLLELDQLPKSVLAMAVKSARLLNRQVAGIDIVRAKDSNQWFVLEVNEGPQLSSGVLLKEKQQAFAKFLDSYQN
ncbi:MAG: ATP-grasp domain-containing protein [Candidatus Saccharimonadales bacterium]